MNIWSRKCNLEQFPFVSANQQIDLTSNGLKRFTTIKTRNLVFVLLIGLSFLLTLAFESRVDAQTNFWQEVPYNGRTDFAPSAVAVGNDVYVFVRGLDGPGIWYQKVDHTDWRPVPALPGDNYATSEPAVTLFGYQILLVVRGKYGLLYQNYFTPRTGNWSGWQQIPGGLTATSAPSVVAYGDGSTWGRAEYYVTGVDGRIYVKYYYFDLYCYLCDEWSNWQPVPSSPFGQSIGGPSAVVFEGKTHLYVRGIIDAIFETVNEPSGWRSWQMIPEPVGITLDRPGTVINTRDRRLYVIVRGYDNKIYLRFKDSGGTWSSLEEANPYGGVTMASPAAVYLNRNNINFLQFFVKWREEKIYYTPLPLG